VIGSLRGVLIDRVPKGEHAVELLVEAGGVGYRVVSPSRMLARDPGLGGPVFVHVHTHVREDAIILYGFTSREERQCFEVLIGAHGVGPAVALAMLAVHTPMALRRAVATEDTDALMLVPGVGRKTASRLLVELRSRLDVDDEEEVLAVVGAGGAAGAARQELRAALAGLGYGPEEIRHVVGALPSEGTVEELLRLALRDLATAR
jgi:Holliday junction DNA helicase RuvA